MSIEYIALFETLSVKCINLSFQWRILIRDKMQNIFWSLLISVYSACTNGLAQIQISNKIFDNYIKIKSHIPFSLYIFSLA